MEMNRVLLADDDPILARLLQVALQEWGWEAVIRPDAESAWQVLSSPDAPRLAILDWMLPDTDGIELCRRIRSQENAPYIYIILLTGKSARKDLIKGMEAGADDYLIKPCDLEELQMRLRAGQRILDLQSSLLEAQAELQRQATHDVLTEIWNRRAILNILQREAERSRRQSQVLSVIMADVDHFKSINDNYGHPAGDKVLHDVAQCIKSCLRTYDAVGRYGGEEFLVVLPNCSEESAVEIAERIRFTLENNAVTTESASLAITMSLGVASGKGELIASTDKLAEAYQADERELIANADAALYQAKQQGRNRVVLSQKAS
jgi:diguanylate cyclase (GGDEF)-like protein